MPLHLKSPVNAQDSITFSLHFNGTLSESDISNVRFQWGTALDEGSLGGIHSNAVPEPASLILMGTGAALVIALGCRRRWRG